MTASSTTESPRNSSLSFESMGCSPCSFMYERWHRAWKSSARSLNAYPSRSSTSLRFESGSVTGGSPFDREFVTDAVSGQGWQAYLEARIPICSRIRSRSSPSLMNPLIRSILAGLCTFWCPIAASTISTVVAVS